MTPADLPERIASKIEVGASCWEWRANRLPAGYGQVRWGGRPRYAHRVVYEILRGPIPDGMVIDHLCRNTSCVNPEHLEVVTSRENTLRGSSPVAQRARQTHCIHGHEFTPDNTYVKANGTRRCRECGRIKCAQYMRERRAA